MAIKPCDVMEAIRAIEFFSGIGGLHYGLKASRFPGDVVAAFDVNEVANRCYSANFPSTRVSTFSIEHMVVQDVERWKANMWLLSPPCQPFTRGGKALDHLDDRCRGIQRLISFLATMEDPPTYLVLENVLNFEKSVTRAILVNTLTSRGYTCAEALLEPTCLGVPNRRLRYFLLARRTANVTPLSGPWEPSRNEDAQENGKPPYSERAVIQTVWPVELSGESCSERLPMALQSLGSFLDKSVDPEALVPEVWIRKSKRFVFDIVSSCGSRACSTFTKAYGSHHVFGSGSFLSDEDEQVLKDENLIEIERVLALRPRFFTPREIARLHCFPDSMVFPPEITRAQQYRLLGNSLNVRLVAELINVLVCSASA